jgi:hypothetical protein
MGQQRVNGPASSNYCPLGQIVGNCPLPGGLLFIQVGIAGKVVMLRSGDFPALQHIKLLMRHDNTVFLALNNRQEVRAVKIPD